MKRRPPQRHTAQRQETRSVASMKQASEVRDPQRSISTAELAAILQRCGVLEFVAHTLSQPRCKPPPAALKRRTWPMGAFKGQKLTAASACGPTEHQPRARRTLSPTPLTSCQPPPPSFAEMNTPSSPSTAPAAPSYFDQASRTSSSPALPQLLPLHTKLRQGNQKAIAGPKGLLIGALQNSLRIRSHNIQKKHADAFALHQLSQGVGVQVLQELNESPTVPTHSLFGGHSIKYFYNIPKNQNANGTEIFFSRPGPRTPSGMPFITPKAGCVPRT